MPAYLVIDLLTCQIPQKLSGMQSVWTIDKKIETEDLFDVGLI